MGLISRSKREDEFTAFAAAHSGALLRTARFLTGDHHHAEDLLQATLTKTYLAWTTARGDHAHAYARRVMVTTHTDTWRRRRWREELTDHHEMTTDTGGHHGASLGADPATTASDVDSLQRTLAVLSQRERSVIVLRYCEDLTEQQTAQLLRVSLGTVKTLHSRAMTKLRHHRPPPLPGTQGSNATTSSPPDQAGAPPGAAVLAPATTTY